MIQNIFICKHHIEEEAIKSFISANAQESFCNYCNKHRPVIALDMLKDFILDGIYYFYSNIKDEVTSEATKTFNSYDLLFDELKLNIGNNDLRKDLVNCIPEYNWTYRKPIDNLENVELYYTWEEFKQIVKHKIRFSFFYIDKVKYENISVDVSHLLKSIIRLMKRHKLIRKIPTDTTLYRCRQHSQKADIKTYSSICSPPKEYVTFSNRMSPAGISMFYAGFDLKTAFKETVDTENKSKPYFTIGSFKPKYEIDVVDFTKTPPIPSVFDKHKRKNYYSLIFLHRLIDDLSKAIQRDGQEHIDYVPTQIITEYIRYFFSKSLTSKVGGIIYPSTKVYGSKACVLFLNHEESVDELQFIKFDIEHRTMDNISANLL